MVFSADSSAFCRLHPSTSLSAPPEPYETANFSSNRAVSSAMTFCVGATSPGNNSSDNRNCPSANCPLPSSLDPSTPSGNSSFQSASSCPTSSYMSPRGRPDFRVKEENRDLDEPYRISSVYSSCPNSGDFLQMLFPVFENPELAGVVKEEVSDSTPSEVEVRETQSTAVSNDNVSSQINNPAHSSPTQIHNFEYFQRRISQLASQVTADIAENVPCRTPTSRIINADGKSNAFSIENNVNSSEIVAPHVPTIGMQHIDTENNSNLTEKELELSRSEVHHTKNVASHPPTIKTHQPETETYTNLTEKESKLSSSETHYTENVSNTKAQQSQQDGTIAASSSSKIEEIDLTGEDDDGKWCSLYLLELATRKSLE